MRSRTVAFGCLLIGGVMALIASAQPWWGATGEGVAVTFTGTQVTAGLSQALAIVALAGTVLMLVLRSGGRRVVGALLLLVALGIALAGGLRLQPSADAVRSQVREVSLVDAFRLNTTAWPWIFAFAGFVIAVGAAVTMITAGRWPARSNRFQPQLGQAAPASSEDSAELWKAMDAGADPTTDASVARAAEEGDASDTPTVADPNVRDRRSGDTMEDTEQAQLSPRSPTSHSGGHVERGRREGEA
jgi:uncharacterized membrane protein (TIGR02234 family)